MNIVLRSIEKLRVIAKGYKDILQREVFRNAYIINSDNEVNTLLGIIDSVEN